MKKLLLLCIPGIFLQAPLVAAMTEQEPAANTTWEKIAYNGSLFAYGAATIAAAGLGALVADKCLNGRIASSKAVSSMFALPSLFFGYTGSMAIMLPLAKKARDSAAKNDVCLDDKKVILAGAALGAAVSGLCFYGLYQK